MLGGGPFECLKMEAPVATWAGEVEDWVQERTMHPPKKDEVIAALLKMDFTTKS